MRVIVPGPLHQGVSGSSAFLVAFYDSSRHALGLVCLPPQLRCLPLARCSLQSLSSRPPSHSRSYQLGRAPRATNRGRPESPQSSRGRLGSRGLEQSPSAGRRSIPVPVTSVEETKDFRSEDFGAGAQTCVPAPLPVSPFLRGAGIADLRRPPRDYCQKIYHPLECFADSNKSLGPRHAVHTRDEAVIPGVNAPTRQGGCHVGIDMSSPPGGELVASPGTECDLLDVALRRALEAASLPGTCPAHEGPPTALLWISCYLASHSRSGRESNQLPSLRSSAREYLVSVSGREGCLYAWRLGKESDATKEQPTLPATMHDAQKREVSSSAVASYARDAPACLTERNWLSSRRKDQTDEDSGLGHLLSRHDWEPSFPAGDDARAKRTEMSMQSLEKVNDHMPRDFLVPALPVKSCGFQEPLGHDNDYTRSSTPNHPRGLAQKQNSAAFIGQDRGWGESGPLSRLPAHPEPGHGQAKRGATTKAATSSRFQYQTRVNEDCFEAEVVLRGTVNNVD
ncbi:hypothetical protein CSUI_000676 [Cystoisospora suis]|uniref:Uncharacterized protein n=1 Tax=Cystoisospora suis TaxID=483139 RepID=A0A2C6LD28_9APIC|nr:hypothetical protein CSUI_000676 [Cystoisospora suis]